MYDYEDLTWYDYYLVRGFAVVECGGLGTKGSEGFETCGSDLEIDAFKCVIEWLIGERVAYTDKTSNIAIEADWSNGKVGMTGRSYAGTTQFGLATTGAEGLETIVPVAGIASWYEYTNSQGIATRSDPASATGWPGTAPAGTWMRRTGTPLPASMETTSIKSGRTSWPPTGITATTGRTGTIPWTPIRFSARPSLCTA